MRHAKRWLMMLMFVLALEGAAVMAYAAEETAAEETTAEETVAVVENGWDAEKTHYYKKGEAVTGLQTINKKKYYFGKDGVVLKNAFKKNVKDGKKKYTFYFGKDGAAYKAKKNNYDVTCKVKKIGGKAYGFDEKSHMVTGTWVASDGKLYVFKKNGKQDTAKTKKLRKLTKNGKKSKSLLKTIKKASAFGKPKKIRTGSSCLQFGKYSENTVFTDYILYYANVQVELVKNETSGVYMMNTVWGKAK